MTLRLEQVAGPLRFQPDAGHRVTLGRAPECDLIVADPSVSRRHAILEAGSGTLRITDLGSANGIRVNGQQITTAEVHATDLVTFGGVAFRVSEVADAPHPGDAPEDVAVRTLAPDPAADRPAALEALFRVVAGLSGEYALPTLLEEVVALVFAQVEADRVALLLAEEAGALRLAAGQNRVGERLPVVPRSIAERAMAERAAVITASARDDARFGGQSVHLQAVQSAICVPLLAGDDVVGVLYADTITRPLPFRDEDARLLHAFAGLAAVAILRIRLAEEARREREVRSTFERFFAPEVAATITQAVAPARLGGARLPVAVLFSDIRGFTGLAERLPPEAVSALLGDYYAVAVDAIFEHGGTLDKFIGDAVMAVWGAPVPMADAAARALAAARTMRDAFVAVNARRAAQAQPVIPVGFGLSHGEVFAGNIGTERRLEYTVVGDAVNIASHLCQEADAGEILVAGSLTALLPTDVGLEPRPPLEAKGRAGSVEVFRAR